MVNEKYRSVPLGTEFRGNLEDCMKSRGLRFHTVSDIWQCRLEEINNGGPGPLCNGSYLAYSGIVVSDDLTSVKAVPDMNRLIGRVKAEVVDSMLRLRYSDVPGSPVPVGKDAACGDIHMRNGLEKGLVPDNDLRVDYFWDAHTMHCPIEGKEPEPISIKPRLYTPNRILLEMRGLEDSKGTYGYLQLAKVGPVPDGSAITSAWVTSPGCFLSSQIGKQAEGQAYALDYTLLHMLQNAARECYAKDEKLKSRGRRNWNILALRAGNGDLTELLRKMRAQEGKMASAIELARNGVVDDATFRKLMKGLFLG